MNALDVLAPHLRPDPTTLRPRLVGVYFLISKDVIVYVGQSTDVEVRVVQQTAKRRRRRRVFDRAAWIELPEADLSTYEGALIRALRPKYNRVAPTKNQRDDEVLARLGLPPIDPAMRGLYHVQKPKRLGRRVREFRRRAQRRSRARNLVAKRMRLRGLLWCAIKPILERAS